MERNETYQSKYHMVFEAGSNPTVINDAVFHGPVYTSELHRKAAEMQNAESWLTRTIDRLKAEGKGNDARSVLSPYAAAFMEEMIGRMTAADFNGKFGVSIPESTYLRWMSPVFNDGEVNFTSADINCYLSELKSLKMPEKL